MSMFATWLDIDCTWSTIIHYAWKSSASTTKYIQQFVNTVNIEFIWHESVKSGEDE